MQEYILSNGRTDRNSEKKTPKNLRFEIPRLTRENNTQWLFVIWGTQNDKVMCCAILRHLELKSTIGN